MNQQATFNLQYIVANGIRLAYSDNGDRQKPAILFIHGLGSHMQVWRYTVPHFQNNYRCITIDLPGHGKSEAGDYPYTPLFFSEVVKAFMDALKLDNLILCGHSMGGQIAMLCAIRWGAEINRLILAAPAGLERFNAWERKLLLRTVNMRHIAISGMEWWQESNKASEIPMSSWTNILSGSDEERYAQPAVIRACIAGMLDNPVFTFLKSITVPVIIIFGTDDKYIPNPYIHPKLTLKNILGNTEKEIPHARIKLIANAGHYLQVDQNEHFNRIVSDFLLSRA